MLEGVSVRSRNGAPSRMGCAIKGQGTKASKHERVRPQNDDPVGKRIATLLPSTTRSTRKNRKQAIHTPLLSKVNQERETNQNGGIYGRVRNKNKNWPLF